MKKKTILALSWRDLKAPKSGGAEVHTHEMLKRIDQDKFRVIHFSPLTDKLQEQEVIDGITYLRKGNVITVIWYAFCYYKKHRKQINYVIDQCNTHRFFTPLWVSHKKRIFYIHQLTKEIWDYNASFPLNKIGKALEEFFLWLNRNDYVITVSNSTKQELIIRGYQEDKIAIIPNGVSFVPWSEEQMYRKEDNPTFIFAGRYSPYKGIDIAIQSFAELKKIYPSAKLWILGNKDQKYIDGKLMPICNENNLHWCENDKEGDIVSWGFVSEEKKLELLSRAHALLFPSIREGWGIPITEAGDVGTPSIVFNSPGIIDAVDNGKAGYVCKNNDVQGLLSCMKQVIEEKELYAEIRKKAYLFSKQFIWDNTGNKVNIYFNELK